MDQLGVRGLTIIQELLNGFEDDSDFIISQHEPSILNSRRERTGTMMTSKTLNAKQRTDFECLIEECRQYVEDLKVMEEDKEFADRNVEAEEAHPATVRQSENVKPMPSSYQ